jgi:serine protease Do
MRLFALLLALALIGGLASAQSALPERAVAMPSSTAEGVYAAARSKLLQIRTVVAAAGRQSSIGSGFLVSADGIAITNYHVVSQYALEPATYKLEYIGADGTRGELKLLAIDLENDLALVKLDRTEQVHFEFDERSITGNLPKGERLYSMGNPLDLGFTIVEGTYNGPVERSYGERIHFSGAINSGMSGGPTVNADGRVAGINVSKRWGGELVSFLVPARFAARLRARAPIDAPPRPQDFRAEIGRQLTAWQAGLHAAIGSIGFRSAAFGGYEAAESAAPWFSCWANTNAGQVPKPRAAANTTTCNSDTRLFVAGDLSTGLIQLTHAHLRSIDLNPFQFATFVSQYYQPSWPGGSARKWHTKQRCHEDFAVSEGDSQPPVRAVWCARAYREFAGLYDVSVMTVTQDSGSQALVSRLFVQGVSYENGLAMARRFLDSLKWSK